MTATAATPRAYDPIDLSSRAFWSTSAHERERSFAELRAERPVSWHPPVEDALMTDPDDPVTGRSPAATTSSRSAATTRRSCPARASCSRTFPRSCSKRRSPSWRWTRRGTPSFANSSAPRSPRGRSGASRIRSRQTRKPSSRSSKPPAAVPTSSTTAPRSCPFARCRTWWAFLSRSGNASRTPPMPWSRLGRPGVPRRVATRWRCCSRPRCTCTRWPATLAAERREHPGDDLFSSLVNAEVDGDRLADADIAAFFVLLTVAGNDTTRQTTSHALKALTDFPDQRAWLLEDFDNRIWGSRRGVHPLGHAGDDLPPHGRNGFRARRPNHPRRREGGDVLFVRQLGHRGRSSTRSASI